MDELMLDEVLSICKLELFDPVYCTRTSRVP